MQLKVPNNLILSHNLFILENQKKCGCMEKVAALKQSLAKCQIKKKL